MAKKPSQNPKDRNKSFDDTLLQRRSVQIAIVTLLVTVAIPVFTWLFPNPEALQKSVGVKITNTDDPSPVIARKDIPGPRGQEQPVSSVVYLPSYNADSVRVQLFAWLPELRNSIGNLAVYPLHHPDFVASEPKVHHAMTTRRAFLVMHRAYDPIQKLLVLVEAYKRAPTLVNQRAIRQEGTTVSDLLTDIYESLLNRKPVQN